MTRLCHSLAQTLAKSNTYCLYIASIGIPVLFVILMEIVDHFRNQSRFLTFLIVVDVSLFVFHISGFLFGIAFERWTREDEEYQVIPDKV